MERERRNADGDIKKGWTLGANRRVTKAEWRNKAKRREMGRWIRVSILERERERDDEERGRFPMA